MAEAGKPRLLVLASTYPRWSGDPEPGFVHELAKRMTADFDVVVLCPHARGAMRSEMLDGVRVQRYRYALDRLETLVNDGGIATNLRRSRWKSLLVPGFLLSMAWAAWRTIAKEHPDAIHAHWLIPQGLVAALLRTLDRRTPPYLVTSHGADLFALRSAPMQCLKRFVARRASALTVVSSAMRDELGRIGVDLARVEVQPMGVDLQHRFTPEPSAKRSRNEILFVGRLVEKKGLRHLLDAMPAILATHPSACLSIVGFGPEEADRRAQAKRLGVQDKVRFMGAIAQDRLPALYRRAAVFVAPFVEAASGDREGLGLVAVEAAGCACPVVVSDLPAVWQVFPEGASVIRVRAADPALLAKGVLSVLEGKAAAANAEEIDRLRSAFDWRARSRQYARLLTDIVGRGPA